MEEDNEISVSLKGAAVLSQLSLYIILHGGMFGSPYDQILSIAGGISSLVVIYEFLIKPIKYWRNKAKIEFKPQFAGRDASLYVEARYIRGKNPVCLEECVVYYSNGSQRLFGLFKDNEQQVHLSAANTYHQFFIGEFPFDRQIVTIEQITFLDTNKKEYIYIC